MNENGLNEQVINSGINSDRHTHNVVIFPRSNVDLEAIINNPSRYIESQIIPICEMLWSKNIESFVVQGGEENQRHILLQNLSDENLNVARIISEINKRFFVDFQRNTCDVIIKEGEKKILEELKSFIRYFSIQDTKRFITSPDFIERYKDKAGDLYVFEEGRIYENSMYLEWHKRYQNRLRKYIKDEISSITPIKENFNDNVSYLRDVYLESEKEYVLELLKKPENRDFIMSLNEIDFEGRVVMAQKYVNDIDCGKISESEIETYEKRLVLLLASIQDREYIKELIKTPLSGIIR